MDNTNSQFFDAGLEQMVNTPNSGGLMFKGTWHFELFNAETGEKELDHIQDNIIVDNAVVHMANGFGPSDFDFLHLGNAAFPSTPNVSQTALDQDFFQGSTTHIVATSPGVFAFQKKCSLATTDAVGTSTESGLFTVDNVMLNRILLSPAITKTSSQTGFITVTITIRRV